MESKALTELAKAGILFLVMGIGLWFFWKEIQKRNELMYSEITQLRIETKECSKNYQDLLINQLKKNDEQINKNNEYLFKAIRRYD